MTKILKYSISHSSKILFMGSDHFAYHPLVSLHVAYPNLDVVTHHTQPGVKASNKVEQYCRSKQIPYSTPIHKTTKQERKKQWNTFKESILPNKYDLGVICSYGFMIPQQVIKCFKEGMIVIHPSLLPKYRGGAPIFHTIANGDTESGVSFIQTSVNVFDAGNILYQTHVAVPKNKQYLEIEEMLSINAADNLVYVLQNISQLRPGKKQNKQQQSKAPIVNSKLLDLREPSQRVYNLSRAIKGPRVNWQGKQLIIKLKDQYVQVQGDLKIGTVFRKGKKGVFVTCGDNRAVRMVQFKQPSKVFYPASAFINQYMKDQSVIFT